MRGVVRFVVGVTFTEGIASDLPAPGGNPIAGAIPVLSLDGDLFSVRLCAVYEPSQGIVLIGILKLFSYRDVGIFHLRIFFNPFLF